MIPSQIGDNLETTRFLNQVSYSHHEIRAYPYALRRSYSVELLGEELAPGEAEFSFYATSDTQARNFLAEKLLPGSWAGLLEQITTFRKVKA